MVAPSRTPHAPRCRDDCSGSAWNETAMPADDEPGAEAPSAEPLRQLPDTGADSAVNADLACLQAAVDDWQRQRADLMRQLEQAQSRAEVQAQAAEKRLSEALAQIETLRRGAHAVRARLEAEAHAANKRAEQAEKALERNTTAAEKLRVANVELTTALEAAQGRLADLETEHAVFHEERERLQSEGAADPERVVRLKAEVVALRWALDAQRVAGEQSQAAAKAEVAALRSGYEEELTEWQALAGQREAELVDAQNELVHRLEETQNKADALQHEATAFATRFESLTAELAAAMQARAEITEQLTALMEEHASERATFEAAREREQQQRQAIEALRVDVEAQRATLSERIATLEAQREAALQRCTELHAQLQAATEAHAQERAAFNADMERREQERRRAIEALRVDAETQRAMLSERIATLEAQREVSLQRCTELDAQLQAATEAHAQERAAFNADMERREQEGRRAIEGLQAELEAQRTALSERVVALEAERDAAVRQCAEVEQRQAVAAAEYHQALTGLRTQYDSERAELLLRLSGLEEELRCRDDRILELRADLDRTVQKYTAKQETMAEALQRREADWQAAEQREARLQHQCSELGDRLQELESQNAAQAQAQDEAAAHIAALEGEREALRVRVEQLGTLSAQLERQCERVRAERVPVEEARRLQAENARLEARIAEMELQRAEAAHHHSAAVAGYMVELNERAEAVQKYERELQRLTNELELTRQACEEATTQLSVGREERDDLQRQLAELRAAAASGAPRPADQPARAAPAAGRPAAAPLPEQRLPASTPAKPTERPAGTSGPLAVIHLEQQKALRDAVSECLAGLPGARYLNAPESEGGAARIFVVNLLNRAPEPLAAIAAAAVDVKAQHIIAYCADGTRGFLLGKVDFLVAPLDADSCVARLLESHGTLQRLLAVSENIEMMGALRVALARMRCSTSVALDLRQVTDLFTMIDPEVVLIDLALPGGDALRLLTRLRADPKTRDLPITVLLSPNLDAADFRRHALRTVREQTLSPADLAQALCLRIGIAAPGNVSTVPASRTA